MHYKTIVLELIRYDYPALHEQLRQSRSLLTALEDHAIALRRYHQDWIDRLSLKWPSREPALIASQAMELAILDLRDDLPSASAPSGMEDRLSLAEAMEHISKPTPTA
jgi:hypothetical protein